jgi:predicted ATP-grasp superfamily ATP-dependent carboligase
VRIERYPAEFLPALASAPQGPWIYTGGLENYPRVIERLAAIRPLLGNRGPALAGLRDPAALAIAAKTAGCQFPRWLPQASPEQAQALSDRGWLLKPRRSSGGLSIRWATEESLRLATPATYWQEYVAGQAASAVFVAAAGQAILLGTTRQLVGGDFGLPRPFLYAGSIGPLELLPTELQRLTALGNVLAEDFELRGLFNVDFVRNASGLWVLEVNPRYSASVEVLERITSGQFVALHVAACEGNSLPTIAVQPPAQFAGKAIAYAERACIVSARFAELEQRWQTADKWPAIADLPALGQSFAAGDPIATVFAEGASAEEVEVELRSRASQVLLSLDARL